LEKIQKVLALLICAALVVLSIQIVAASSDCPNCKVVYDDQSTNNAEQQGHTGNPGPLSLLDPSSGTFLSGTQVGIADAVLKLL
jgi:hypothetical protein